MRKTIVRMLTLSITAILLLSGCGKGDNRTEEGKDNQVESIANTPEPTPTEAPQNETLKIEVDENGLATWNAMPDAKEYEYVFVRDDVGYETGVFSADTTSCQLPQGLCLHLRVIYADGTIGFWAISETYGTYVEPETPEDVSGQFSYIEVDENGLATWEAVPDAKEYEYVFVRDDVGYETGVFSADTTSCQLPQGLCLHLRVIYADGTIGAWMISETYGVYIEPVITETPQSPGNPWAMTVDAKGLVTWNVVPDAVSYEYHMVLDFIYMESGSLSADITSYQLLQGHSLHLRPVYADGTVGNWETSATYGTYVEPENPVITAAPPEPEGPVITDAPPKPEDNRELVANGYSVYRQDLQHLDVVSNLKWDTVETRSNGDVYFETVRPDGKSVAFIGTGITLSKDGISVAPGGQIISLDAIGRICAYEATLNKEKPYHSSDWLNVKGGYTFTDKTQVENVKELYCTDGVGVSIGDVIRVAKDTIWLSVMDTQPNFAALNTMRSNKETFTLSEFSIYYDASEETTAVIGIGLAADQNGTYLEGERYYAKKETQADASKNLYNFYLVVVPELKYELNPKTVEERMKLNSCSAVYFVETGKYTVGDLKDANGKVLDKNTAKVNPGTTISVTVGNYTKDVALTTVERYEGASNLHDLVPYVYPEATGTLNTIVIPIAWRDEPEHATDKEWTMFQEELGRVMNEAGEVTDYSEGLAAKNRFSLSQYYDMASYGKLEVQSFLTDWYEAPYDFAQMSTEIPDEQFMKEVMDWLYKTYPDMDWSRFDKDANGYFDGIILLNAGEVTGAYYPGSFSGGIMMRNSSTPEEAGTTKHPAYNAYICVNASRFKENAMIHEFGHILGLEDYYDTTYAGIDALGRYDMMSGNMGDWNSFSKYAAGWITPEIVTGLKSGESVEIEIGAFTTTGDAIVIPAAGSKDGGSVFSEYIMIDLFTDDGLNKYDAGRFPNGNPSGLEGAVGVRMYHVNATMRKKEMSEGGKQYTIGVPHYSNNYDTTGYGLYLVELIQAGASNLFTVPEAHDCYLNESDLFGAGSTFTAETYSEFLYDGKMDTGEAFGYEITVVSVSDGEEPKAVISIKRK